jgi:outer membrane biosynthesis protein TonB
MVQRAMEAVPGGATKEGSARTVSWNVRAWGAALLMISCLACSSAPDTKREGASEVKEPGKSAPSTQEQAARREGESADVDPGALALFVKERLKPIRSCYEEQLKLNPKLQGKVVVLFSIQPTGRVGEIGIEENTLGNEAVGSCICAVIGSWEFPFRPGEEVQIAYPFIFSPAE